MVSEYKKSKNDLKLRIVDCISLSVTATHNNFQGGDAGHGGSCSFEISGDDCDPFYVVAEREQSNKLKVTTYGDAERRVLAEALIEIGNFLLYDIKDKV